jgi:hypothetical protein
MYYCPTTLKEEQAHPAVSGGTVEVAMPDVASITSFSPTVVKSIDAVFGRGLANNDIYHLAMLQERQQIEQHGLQQLKLELELELLHLQEQIQLQLQQQHAPARTTGVIIQEMDTLLERCSFHANLTSAIDDRNSPEFVYHRTMMELGSSDLSKLDLELRKTRYIQQGLANLGYYNNVL